MSQKFRTSGWPVEMKPCISNGWLRCQTVRRMRPANGLTVPRMGRGKEPRMGRRERESPHSPGRRGVECGRPRPPESQQRSAHLLRGRTARGARVEDGKPSAISQFLLKFWEIGRFSLRQMSCFRGVNASCLPTPIPGIAPRCIPFHLRACQGRREGVKREHQHEPSKGAAWKT